MSTQTPREIVVVGRPDLTDQLAKQLLRQTTEGSLALRQERQTFKPSVTILATVQSSAFEYAKRNTVATIAILQSMFLTRASLGFRAGPHKAIQKLEFPGAYWGNTGQLKIECHNPHSDYVCILEEPSPNEPGQELADILKKLRVVDKKSVILRTCISFVNRDGVLITSAYGSCNGQMDLHPGQDMTDCNDWFVAEAYPTYKFSSPRIPEDIRREICPTNRAIRSFIEALKMRQRQ